MKTKVCPECNDYEYLCWSPFNDGTTDCMLCTGNWEEHELKEKEIDVQSHSKNKFKEREIDLSVVVRVKQLK